MNASDLQEIGQTIVFVSIAIALICFNLWKYLPDKYKVWAIVLLVGYCGALMIGVEVWLGSLVNI